MVVSWRWSRCRWSVWTELFVPVITLKPASRQHFQLWDSKIGSCTICLWKNYNIRMYIGNRIRNKYERHVHPIAMSVTSDIFSVPKLCPTFGRIENMTSLITWEIRPCCASTAIFVLELFCLSMMSGPEFKDIATHLSFTLFASWLSSFLSFSFSFCCDKTCKMYSKIEVDEPHLLDRLF